MLVLVVYDIPDNKRRLRVSKVLEGYGRRVQESVFECFITFPEMQKLHQKVLWRVKPQEDNVRFYWIAADAVARILTIGSEVPQSPPEFYVI